MKGKRINWTSNKFYDRVLKKSTKILVVLIIIICLIAIFANNCNSRYIKYTETGKADYNVSINKNDFFEDESLPANNQYIASLINTININYNYSLKMESKFKNYKYKWRVEQETKVVDKTTQNDIYSFKDTVKDELEVTPEDDKFTIDSSVAIDYSKYDAITNKIISTYDLSNVNCKTVVTMYVDLLDEKGNVKNTESMSVSIPLNSKTVSIDIENAIDGEEIKIFENGEYNNANIIFIIIAVILAIYAGLLIKKLVEYVKKNCPPELVNNLKRKRILREYKQYIQKVNNGFDFSKYFLLRVEKFEDLLKIREIVQNPILWFENETETKTYFVITTSTDIVYIYELNHGNVKEISE